LSNCHCNGLLGDLHQWCVRTHVLPAMKTRDLDLSPNVLCQMPI
jgi:hypothetical protein